MAVDRTTVLTKLPANLHVAADALAAQGVDWNTIMALLMQLLPLVLSIFKKPQPVATTAGCEPCPEQVKAALDETQQKLLEALASNVCAKHCLECCDE